MTHESITSTSAITLQTLTSISGDFDTLSSQFVYPSLDSCQTIKGIKMNRGHGSLVGEHIREAVRIIRNQSRV